MHTLVGGGSQQGGYNALDYRKIKQGNAGPLGTYLSSLCCLINSLDFCLSFTLVDLKYLYYPLVLPLLPDDRSQFDVHGALEDDKVKQFECLK
jgi:hypothetical protein